MKKTDVAMVILIASVSVMVAFIVANSIPALKVSDMKADVPDVIQVQPNLTELDKNLFNDSAINPTQQTIIGSNQ